MNNNTIAQVVKDGLCTGCGTCIALCPEEAIKLTINEKKGIYVSTLNEEKCNNCGICYEVCPGHEVDFKRVHYLILTTKKIFLRMNRLSHKPIIEFYCT
ncbi:Ferredoxin [ANME-1 cluster archaeon GoMg3.2]|nr:Ferredoxin [ANME-1 cluster archaeon GoMg3.2]